MAALPRRGRSRPATSGSSSARTATCRPTRRQLVGRARPRGLKLSAGTVFTGFHKGEDQWQRAWDQAARGRRARREARRRAPRRRSPTCGAATPPSEVLEARTLDRRAVGSVSATGHDQLGKALLEEFGVKQQFHTHADSHVGTYQRDRAVPRGDRPARTRTSASTPATSPTTAATTSSSSTEHPERIGYLHLKQVDTDLLLRRAEERRAVRRRRRAGHHGRAAARHARSSRRSSRPSPTIDPDDLRHRRAGHVRLRPSTCPSADRRAHPRAHLRLHVGRPRLLTRRPRSSHHPGDTTMSHHAPNLRVAVVGAGMMGADHVRRITATDLGRRRRRRRRARRRPRRGRRRARARRGHRRVASRRRSTRTRSTPSSSRRRASSTSRCCCRRSSAASPILCEKPLTDERRGLAARSSRLEQQLDRPHIQVGFMRRFDAGLPASCAALRRVGRSGRAARAAPRAPQPDDAAELHASRCSSHDSVIHEIDIVPFLAGEPIVERRGEEAAPQLARAGATCPSRSSSLFTTESGTLAIVEINVNVQFGYQVTTDAVFESRRRLASGARPLQLAAAGGDVRRASTPSFKERFAAAYDDRGPALGRRRRGRRRSTGRAPGTATSPSVVAEAGVRAQQSGAHEAVEYAVAKPAFYDGRSPRPHRPRYAGA